MATQSGPEGYHFDRTLECVYRTALDILGASKTLRFDFESVSDATPLDHGWRIGDLWRAALNYARLVRDLQPILRTARRQSPEGMTRNALAQIASLCIVNAASATLARAQWKALLDWDAPVSHLFIAAWYFPDALGLIAAAHEMDCVVIDVQHGQQGAIHGMYCGWNNLAAYKENIPDLFWLWNDYTADNIRRTSQPEIDSHLVVGGRCLPVNTDTTEPGSPDASATSEDGDRAVLVALQPANRDAEEPIPPRVLDYLDRLRPSIVIIKPHPAMGASVLDNAVEVISSLPYRIDLRPAQEPLALTMRTAGLHLTSHSSSVFDAIHFKVPSVLWGSLAGEQFRSVLDAGIAWQIDDAPTDWESIRNAPTSDILDYFEPTDPDAVQESAFREVLRYARSAKRASGDNSELR